MSERYVDKTGTDEKPNPLRDVYLEFPYAMDAVAAVTAFGARKHAPRGWRTFDHDYALNYHLGKIGRHLKEMETDGPVNHQDGDNLHMAAVAWNALAYLDHYLRAQPKETPSGKALYYVHTIPAPKIEDVCDHGIPGDDCPDCRH